MKIAILIVVVFACGVYRTNAAANSTTTAGSKNATTTAATKIPATTVASKNATSAPASKNATTTAAPRACNVTCLNYATQETNCSCSCFQGYKGVQCEQVNCDVTMHPVCNSYSVTDCATYQGVRDFCPAMCGGCKPNCAKADAAQCATITKDRCSRAGDQVNRMKCPHLCGLC